jgi:hypothetical protein
MERFASNHSGRTLSAMKSIGGLNTNPQLRGAGVRSKIQTTANETANYNYRNSQQTEEVSTSCHRLRSFWPLIGYNVSACPRLSATFLLGLTFGGFGFGMGRNTARRQRGVLGRPSPAFRLRNANLESGDRREQQAKDGLGFGRALISSMISTNIPHMLPKTPSMSRSIYTKNATGV